MMKARNIENDEETDTMNNDDENENENLASIKIIDKQLFLDNFQTIAGTIDNNQIVIKADETENEQKEPVKYWPTFCRIMKIAKPEWFFLFLATIAAVFIGASFPGFAILFGEFYGVFKKD